MNQNNLAPGERFVERVPFVRGVFRGHNDYRNQSPGNTFQSPFHHNIWNKKVTKQEEDKSVVVTWPCNGLTILATREDCYHSETFSLSICPLMDFALFIETSRFPSLKIGLVVKNKPDEQPVSLRAKFWLKAEEELKCEVNKIEDKIEFKTSEESNKRFIEMLGRDKKLIISCKIECLSAVFKAPDNLIKALWKIYEDGQGHDVVIEVDGREFKVLSAVFTSQSEVFASMFSKNYVEGQDKKVFIEEVTVEAFEAFVRWMYIKEIRNLDTLEELYVLANKYLIQAPNAQELIFVGLNKENAARRLALFSKYNETVLTERVMAFIYNLGPTETKKVFESKDWFEYLIFKNS
ncbi:BTB/POZ-like [Aphelenchoides bicaudatus]|nr:BTB/POZ-like [Aphelenchoides bicaudatus]